jgi:hypothetical protein
MGHKISHRMVAELLHELNYSLQANRKTSEGSSHPDRNAQFEYISQKVRTTGIAGGLLSPKRALLLAPLKGYDSYINPIKAG